MKGRVLVAFSSGPDSTYLLHYLIARIGRENVGICYVNHGLRASSYDEEKRVRRVARELDVYYCIVRARVKELARDRNWSIEEAGRRLRYRILMRVADRRNFRYIATGHNLNDAFETFIMHSLKGSGAMGIVLPPRRGRIIRPLILMEKERILEHLHRREIGYSIDETNLMDDFFRNFLRNQVESKILERFPHALKGFRRTYLNLLENYRFTLKGIKALFKESILFRRRRFYVFDVDKLLEGDGYLVSTLFSRMVPGITRKHIKDVMGILKGGGKVNVPGNIFFHSQYGLLSIYKSVPQVYGTFFIYPQSGFLKVSDIAHFRYWVSDRPVMGPEYMSIPLNKVSFPLRVRGRRRGDRVGRRKLKEALVDWKIPSFLREAIPVVESMGEIIFVPGVFKKRFRNLDDSAYLIIETGGFIRRFVRR